MQGCSISVRDSSTPRSLQQICSKELRGFSRLECSPQSNKKVTPPPPQRLKKGKRRAEVGLSASLENLLLFWGQPLLIGMGEEGRDGGR